MRWLTTTVLAVLLVGLGTFYYVYEIRQAPDREKAASAKDRLWKELEGKDVEEIIVKKGDVEALRLKRSGDTWSLIAPVAASADKRAADDLATSLATLRVEREIEANPQKPADFGLAPPAAEVTFKAKGQDRTVKLGAKSPSGVWAYAQEGAKPAIILVPEGILTDTQKPPSEYRDKTLLAFDRKDVKTVEVRAPAGQVVASAAVKGTDEWQLTAPLTAPADREAISALLEKLRSAKIKEFVTDAPKNLAEYGLDRPTRVSLGVGEEASRTTRALRFGKAVPGKKGVYAQREGDGAVLLVDEDLGRSVPASAMAFRDKTVFAYDRSKLERVELDSPKGKVALALQDGKWRITSPVGLRADEGAMSQVLFKASGLKAKDFVAEDAKRLAAYGLDKPQIRITVWEKDAKEPKALLLAPGREKDRAYVTTLGAGAAGVAAVDATALADLARGVTDLRDRSLSEAFDTKDVTHVAIQRPTGSLALDRTGTGEEDWQLTAPKKGKTRGGRVSELLWTLRNLKWKDLVADQGWDPARYGLDAGATTITLTGKDGKTLAALVVGKQEGGVTYVRIPDQPALYAIDSKTLGDLPGTPEELLLYCVRRRLAVRAASGARRRRAPDRPAMAETIQLEVADGVALLTLNEPARRNPMSERMGEELAAALAGVEPRADVRVLVLAGAGESFCAGGDMALIEANTRRDVEARRQVMRAYYDRYLSLLRLPIPTIAAVHGHAVGGGLALALACDLRYAAEDARLSVNFARLGLHPGMASTLTLPRAVGAARALELFYTGRVVSGREAEAMGLVNRAVAPAALMATVLETARTIAANAPLVVRMLKRAVYQGLESAVTAAVEYEAFCQAITFGSEDLQEGLRAARERRPPRFGGR